MEGKRFGFGLVAGLLVALVVVAATGGFGSLSSTASFSPAENAIASSTVQSTIATVTEVLSTTSSMSTTTSSGSISRAISGNESYVVAATTTAVSSSVSSGLPPMSSTATASTSVPGLGYSSRVENIAQQPLLSNAVILVPVLVAFLLGAFLYRLSVRNREPPGV